MSLPDPLRDRVEAALRAFAAPALDLNPADIAVVGVSDGVAQVRFSGSCLGCAGGVHVLVTGLEQELRKHVPGVEFIEAVS